MSADKTLSWSYTEDFTAEDEATAQALMRGPDAERYRVRACHEVVAKGLGNITPWELSRI